MEGRALELSALSGETLKKLAPFIPATGSVGNPVDLTFAKDYSSFFSEIPGILLAEENADILMVYLLSPPRVVERVLKGMGLSDEEAKVQVKEIIASNAGQFVRLLKTQEKPIIGYSFHRPDSHIMGEVIARGVPVFQGAERAARAMACIGGVCGGEKVVCGCRLTVAG